MKRLNIILKKSLLGVSNHYLFIYTLQKDTTNVYVRPIEGAMKPFKIASDINCFVIIIPLTCIKPHVPLFSIVQSIVNGIIEPIYRA